MSEPGTVVERTEEALSIGEVLALLQEEFPDVTISKIRFLESQGLISPERTASGYRRFRTADVERLRWILRQQRDHFLPLKVIRRMLDEGVDRYDPGGGEQPTLFTPSSGADGFADGGDGSDGPESDDEDEDDATATGVASGSAAAPSGGRPSGRPPRSPNHPAVASAPPSRRLETPADVVAALQEDPRPAARRAERSGATAPDPPERPAPPIEAPPVEGEVGAEELCSIAGVSPELLEGLERFGLVRPVVRGGLPGYGPDAVTVARVAGRYAELGVEPRHLRMYLVAAEREAGFVEQLAVPILKQRHPEARVQARALAGELTALGAQLHDLLLARELGDDLG